MQVLLYDPYHFILLCCGISLSPVLMHAATWSREIPYSVQPIGSRLPTQCTCCHGEPPNLNPNLQPKPRNEGGLAAADRRLIRPLMYSISSFHSWNSSGLDTTRLAMHAPAHPLDN